MESSELRIGNLVLNKFNNETIEIESVGNDGINLYSQGDYENHHYLDCEFRLSDISPIPLTEEWLIKFGFEKTTTGIYYHYLFNYVYNKGVLSVGCDNENGYEIPIRIEYVHQFQNLYIALTGNELSIINPQNIS